MGETILASNGNILPFYYVDVKTIRNQYSRWHQALPFIKPHYAVKCNPDPVVLRTLYECGAGFDCASISEINQALRFVTPTTPATPTTTTTTSTTTSTTTTTTTTTTTPTSAHPPQPPALLPSTSVDQILFANPIKEATAIVSAADLGVHKMTVDSVEELQKIAVHNPHALVMVRILVNDIDSRCPLGTKYGTPMKEVNTIMLEAQRLNIQIVGVSFHVGSGQTNPQAYVSAIQRARIAFDIGADCGHVDTMNILNIGGGFIDDGNFEQIAQIITTSIEEAFPRWQVEGNEVTKEGEGRLLSVIAEPGRFFVSESFQLVTKVIGRKGSMVYINDSIYGSFNNIMYDHAVVQPAGVMSKRGDSVHWYAEEVSGSKSNDDGSGNGIAKDDTEGGCSIWGQTCDGLDRITRASSCDVNRAEIDEWLIWPNMGAYTSSASSQFNGFEKPNVFYNMEGEQVEELVLKER